MSTYIFNDQSRAAEKQRVDALARLHDAATIRHLSELGVSSEWSCWEVGGGTGTIARWLAARAGRVLVTDLDTRFLEGLPDNVDVQLHDVTAEPPALDAFDLVHARALLEHVSERDVALANLVRSLRPGAWLLAEDVAFPCFPLVVYPEWPLTEKLNAAAAAGFRAAGADSEYGVKLLGKLDEAGLVESGAEVHVPAARTATADVDFVALTLEQLGDKLVAAGLLTAEDVRDGVGAMREPGRVVLGPLMVAAWGRRPPE